jgi:hypothetical protein
LSRKDVKRQSFASQSTTAAAFQAFARRFNLHQFQGLKCVPLLLAADAACSYTVFTGNQRRALKASYNDMDFEAEIRALACRNVSAADSGVIVIGVLTDQVHPGWGRKCPSDLSEALSMELQRLFFLSHPQHHLD